MNWNETRKQAREDWNNGVKDIAARVSSISKVETRVIGGVVHVKDPLYGRWVRQ